MDECALNITQCPDSQLCHNFPGGSSCLCTDSRYGVNCSTSEYLNLASAPFQTALFLTGSVIGVRHDVCQAVRVPSTSQSTMQDEISRQFSEQTSSNFDEGGSSGPPRFRLSYNFFLFVFYQKPSGCYMKYVICINYWFVTRDTL